MKKIYKHLMKTYNKELKLLKTKEQLVSTLNEIETNLKNAKVINIPTRIFITKLVLKIKKLELKELLKSED